MTVEEQLRNYAQTADDRLPWIEPEEVIRSRPREAGSRRQGRKRVDPSGRRPSASSPWISVAWAAGVVLVLGTVGLVVGRTPNPPAFEPVPETSTATTIAIEEDVVGGPAMEATEAPYVGTETGVGQLVWTVFEDAPVRFPSFAFDGVEYVISGPGGLLYSTDGTAWSADSVGSGFGDYASVRIAGDWALAETADRETFVLHSERGEWLPVELPPAVGGSDPHLPLPSGDRVLIPSNLAFWTGGPDGVLTYQEEPWAWPAGTADSWPDVTYVALPAGGFAAYLTMQGVHPDELGLQEDMRDNSSLLFAEVWTSTDGVTWTNRGVPEFIAEGDWTRRILPQVKADGDRLVATILLVDEGEQESIWESTDGVTWVPSAVTSEFVAPLGIEIDDEGVDIDRTDFGYVMRYHDHDGDGVRDDWIRFFISVNGWEWEEIEGIYEPDVDADVGGIGGGGGGALGRLVFKVFTGAGNQLWVGHFEE